MEHFSFCQNETEITLSRQNGSYRDPSSAANGMCRPGQSKSGGRNFEENPSW
ncbi:unnamed protein product [Oikopleura dioica]|uniref:Uncharacterized protein n=1 Tax=Oikopleura dioica TaxID=34765 RepID=E4XJX1_OIKDI|nr:unnamed protein product [Oikopleura dioica]